MKTAKLLLSLIVASTLINSAQALSRADFGEFKPDPTRFASTIEAYLEKDAEEMPPEGAIVGVGSSSMVGWHYRIKEDLAPLTIIPRGFGGSSMSGAIYYAEDIVTKYKPRAIIVYEGDNDIASGKSPETILKHFKFFVELCRSKLPEVRFYFISIKPSVARWDMWPEMVEANKLLSDFADTDSGITYIDMGKALLDDNGQPKEGIFKKDNLHLNDYGYDFWSAACAEVIIPAEKEFEQTSCSMCSKCG